MMRKLREPKPGGRHQYTRPRKAISDQAFNVPIGGFLDPQSEREKSPPALTSRQIPRCDKGARGTFLADVCVNTNAKSAPDYQAIRDSRNCVIKVTASPGNISQEIRSLAQLQRELKR
jgi:hypothetical protein